VTASGDLILVHDLSPLQAISLLPRTSHTCESFGIVRGAAKETYSPPLLATRRYACSLI